MKVFVNLKRIEKLTKSRLQISLNPQKETKKKKNMHNYLQIIIYILLFLYDILK